MKTIMCPTCRGPVVTPKGNDLEMAVYTAKHPMVVKCARCTSSFKLSAIEFAKAPESAMVK